MPESGNKISSVPYIFLDSKSTRNCYIRCISKAHSNLWSSVGCFVLGREIDIIHGVFYTEGKGKLYSFYSKIKFCFLLSPSFPFKNAVFFIFACYSLNVNG